MTSARRHPAHSGLRRGLEKPRGRRGSFSCDPPQTDRRRAAPNHRRGIPVRLAAAPPPRAPGRPTPRLRPAHAPPPAPTARSQGLLAPVVLSASLFGLYLILRYTDFDLTTLLSAYFWLLTATAVAGAGGPMLRRAGDAAGQPVAEFDVPEVGGTLAWGAGSGRGQLLPRQRQETRGGGAAGRRAGPAARLSFRLTLAGGRSPSACAGARGVAPPVPPCRHPTRLPGRTFLV
jgi:hypothetical protein